MKGAVLLLHYACTSVSAAAANATANATVCTGDDAESWCESIDAPGSTSSAHTISPTMLDLNPSEGLGEEQFPTSLATPFRFQCGAFILLYTLLSLRLGIEITHDECRHQRGGGAGKGRKKDRNAAHVVTTGVLVTCVARTIYICVVDLWPEALPAEVGNVLRCFNDCAWFWAFAYLSFFWIELLTSCKRGITKIAEYKRPCICCIAAFTVLRVCIGGFECAQLRAGVICMFCACCIFLAALAGFGTRLAHKLRSTAGISFRASPLPSSHSSSQTLKRFSLILTVEVGLMFLIMMDRAFTAFLRDRGDLDIATNSTRVLCLKVLQRSLEFANILALVYIVLLRSATKHNRRRGRKKAHRSKNKVKRIRRSTSSSSSTNSTANGDDDDDSEDDNVMSKCIGALCCFGHFKQYERPVSSAATCIPSRKVTHISLFLDALGTFALPRALGGSSSDDLAPRTCDRHASLPGVLTLEEANQLVVREIQSKFPATDMSRRSERRNAGV